MEDDKRGDEVGAIRCFRQGDSWKRQRLTAHSDAEHSFSYAGMEPLHLPDQGGSDSAAPATYTGTMRLVPVTDGDRTFIEWFVEFDCQPNDTEQWKALFMKLIPKWVESLSRALNSP